MSLTCRPAHTAALTTPAAAPPGVPPVLTGPLAPPEVLSTTATTHPAPVSPDGLARVLIMLEVRRTGVCARPGEPSPVSGASEAIWLGVWSAALLVSCAVRMHPEGPGLAVSAIQGPALAKSGEHFGTTHDAALSRVSVGAEMPADTTA